MKPFSPLLISFEGGEGVGKSTLINRLFDHLSAEGYRVIKTREPGGTQLGESVRKLLLHQENISICPISEILLFLTSRAQQIHEVIQPHLDKGYIVLCDRYNESTIAYQGIAHGVGQKLTEQLCLLACQNLKPNLTFFLDLDPKVGMQRAKKLEKEWDRIESFDLSFHEKVRKAYLKLADENSDQIKIVDASKSTDEVFDYCWRIASNLLTEKKTV